MLALTDAFLINIFMSRCQLIVISYLVSVFEKIIVGSHAHCLSSGPRLKKSYSSNSNFFVIVLVSYFQKRLIFKSSGWVFLKKKLF